MGCCGGGRAWGHSDLIPIRPSVSQRRSWLSPEESWLWTGRERELRVPAGFVPVRLQASVLTGNAPSCVVTRARRGFHRVGITWKGGLDTCWPSHGTVIHMESGLRGGCLTVGHPGHAGAPLLVRRGGTPVVGPSWFGAVPCRRPDTSRRCRGGATTTPTSPLSGRPRGRETGGGESVVILAVRMVSGRRCRSDQPGGSDGPLRR